MFAHPRMDAVGLCEKARKLGTRCVEFYAQQDTEHIDLAEFSQGTAKVRELIRQLEQIQKLSDCLPEFFDRKNRELIVGLRNLELRFPTYYVTRIGFKWKPDDQDVVDFDPPENYRPTRFRCLGRLRRAVESS